MHVTTALVALAIGPVLVGPLGAAGAQDDAAQVDGTEIAALETWRFELDLGSPSEGAAPDVLPFVVEVDAADGRAWIRNGDESIAVPTSRRDGARWTLAFPHYDSRIELERQSEHAGGDNGRTWHGTWTKERGRAEPASVPVRAVRSAFRFEPRNGLSVAADALAGRWRVDFASASSDVPAVGLFASPGGSVVTGTFLTDTGDYRYLAGDVHGTRLRLSCFDGAHAFLFEADIVLDPDGDDRLIDGTFRSGDWWTESWSATRDDNVALPDPLAHVALRDTAHLEFLAFPDPSGEWRPLWRPGRPAVIEVFGSWCPNCHDAATLLQELHERHGAELDVIGLAFELTGEWERDARQVSRFAERRGVTYPLLVGGVADKASTARALGLTDTFRSYPTTFFIDRDGSITAVYSGFSGPATGAAHLKLRQDVELAVARILSSTATTPAWAAAGSDWTCDRDGPGDARFETQLLVRPRRGPQSLRGVELAPLQLSGTSWSPTIHGHFGFDADVAGHTLDRRWSDREKDALTPQLSWPWADRTMARLVERNGQLLDPFDLRHRFVSDVIGVPALPPAMEPAELEQLPDQLANDPPGVRADRLWLAATRGAGDDAFPLEPLLASLASDDTWVRAHAAAALALIGGHESERHASAFADIDARLRTAVDDPSHLVRREAGRAMAAFALGADLLVTWRSSASPFDRDLARAYAAELARGR